MVNELIKLVIAVLATMLLGRAYAWDSGNDRWQCQNSKTICITSFKWCASGRDSSKGCSFPTGTYLWYRNYKQDLNSALVIWESSYTVTWTNADASYPVMLEWEFGDNQKTYIWSRNFTDKETSFEFSFEELANDLSNSNMKPYEVLAQASKPQNFLRISQPESPWMSKDVSDQFSVATNGARSYVRAQKDNTNKNISKVWKIGVGVGVGIGVALAALAFLGFCLCRKMRARSTPSTQPRSEEEQSRGDMALDGIQRNEVSGQPGTQAIKHVSTQAKDNQVQTGELSARQARVYYR